MSQPAQLIDFKPAVPYLIMGSIFTSGIIVSLFATMKRSKVAGFVSVFSFTCLAITQALISTMIINRVLYNHLQVGPLKEITITIFNDACFYCNILGWIGIIITIYLLSKMK